MAKIDVGSKIPDFELSDHSGNLFQISSLLGKKNLVIYFYPKDETPGCTAQACAFRDNYEEFKNAGAEVIGISSDNAAEHSNFLKNHGLQFTLLSDENGKVRKLFGVPKSFFGLLPGRVTYVVDKDGIVRYIFNSQFNINGHISQSLQILNSLD